MADAQVVSELAQERQLGREGGMPMQCVPQAKPSVGRLQNQAGSRKRARCNAPERRYVRELSNCRGLKVCGQLISRLIN